MIKVVTFFLIGMIVLAMFGRLRLPGRKLRLRAAKCPKCGVLGPARGTCQCGYKGKR